MTVTVSLNTTRPKNNVIKTYSTFHNVPNNVREFNFDIHGKKQAAVIPYPIHAMTANFIFDVFPYNFEQYSATV